MLMARLNKDEVVSSYTAKANVYNLWAWLTESRACRQAIEYASVKDGESILEVAVGTGLTFYQLARRNHSGRNVGVDLTPAMVAKAQAKMASLSGQFELEVGDASKLGYASESFDLLVNNYMFDLLPEAEFVPQLLEFKRLLKGDGRLVLTNMAMPKHFWHGFWEWLLRINPKWLGGCRGVELHKALAEAGFVIQKQRYISQFGFPSEVILAIPG
jgi:ubiquinone/menaquinone biosynthesis C-methylase UbiE